MKNLSSAPFTSKNRVIFIGLFTLLAASSLLLVLLLRSESQQSSTTVTVIDGEDLRTDDELKAGFVRAQLGDTATAWGQDKFILYDIRPAEAYTTSHLEGAVSVPVAWLDRSVIPEDATVVMYSQDDNEIQQGLAILDAKNITEVQVLSDSLASLKERII